MTMTISRRPLLGALVALLCLLAQPLLAAGLVLPPGAAISTGGGQIELGCGDAQLGGEFSGALVGARDILLDPGAVLSQASLGFSGDWTNLAAAEQGASLNWTDGCGVAVSQMLGSSRLPALSATTSSGREIRFDSDGEQIITGALLLAGSEGQRLRLRPSTPFQLAQLTLAVGANQSIDFIDGAYIDSGAGQTIAPDRPDVFNSVISAVMINWFQGEAIPVPTLPTAMILLLVILIGLFGGKAVVRRSA